MSKAKKYQVGKVARKHLLIAVDKLEGTGEDVVVANFPRYEIRATRLPHGVELKWGKLGTFYNPLITGSFSEKEWNTVE